MPKPPRPSTEKTCSCSSCSSACSVSSIWSTAAATCERACITVTPLPDAGAVMLSPRAGSVLVAEDSEEDERFACLPVRARLGMESAWVDPEWDALCFELSVGLSADESSSA